MTGMRGGWVSTSQCNPRLTSANAAAVVAQMRGVMRRVRDNAIVATCEHGKVSVSAPAQEKL